MLPASAPAASPARDQILASARILAVDWARALAYVLMIIAHTAPSNGPARIFMISEFVTAPLFALLVGVGEQLSHRAGSDVGGERAAVIRELLRAGAIAAIGLVLMQSAAAVVIVLVQLAVVMAACLPLVRLRTGALLAVAAAVAVATLTVPALFPRLLQDPGAVDSPALTVLGLLGAGGPYRITGFLLAALVGILLARALTGSFGRSWRGPALASGAALLAMAGLLIAPNLLGLFPVHAYDGTPAEQIGGILGAAGFLLLCWALERSAFGRALPPALARAAAVPGQMALSLYVLQIAVLHVFQIRNPLERDDSWGMLALLLVLGIGGALAWRAVLQRAAIRWPAAARWQRGPLEGAIRLLEDAIAPLPARPIGLRPGASPEISSP